MYRSFGKCKNYTPTVINSGRGDCRSCSKHDPNVGEYEVGDWCKNYSTKTKQQYTKPVVIKPKPKLIKPKDFSSRRT